LWTLALLTGARRGELLGLSWEDVDLDAGIMTIRRALRRAADGRYEVGPTKTSASMRNVRLGATAIAALRGHARRQREEKMRMRRSWQETGLVFTSKIGDALDPGNVRHRWDALARKAGLDGVVLHELRHTAGSHAVDAGLALTEVADQLGHSDVNMLARTYRHRTRPVVEGVAAVMEDFVKEAQSLSGSWTLSAIGAPVRRGGRDKGGGCSP
jgi:integrase